MQKFVNIGGGDDWRRDGLIQSRAAWRTYDMWRRMQRFMRNVDEPL